MKLYCNNETVSIDKVDNDLYKICEKILDHYIQLPEKKDARIVIKPNIHKDMSALMGNTTDLRLITAVIHYYKKREYTNIVVAEGSNCGIYRFNINAYKRLGLLDLLEYLHVTFVDLNTAPHTKVKLPSGDEIKVADIILHNDLFINLPKLKTHHLTGLSVCLKSVMGTVTGMDKRIMHNDLYANITALNTIVKPDIHIVDSLIAMEGQGPGMGIPLKLNTVIAGTDPYFIDAVCTRFAGFSIRSQPLLLKGRDIGRITRSMIAEVSKLSPAKKFIPAQYTLKNKIVDNKYFTWIRDLVRPLFDNEIMSQLLFFSGIREDEFICEDAYVRIQYKKENCNDCGKCIEYCPLDIRCTEDSCIKCLYCYWVCPNKAIEIIGTKGFLEVQINKYKNVIEHIVKDDHGNN